MPSLTGLEQKHGSRSSLAKELINLNKTFKKLQTRSTTGTDVADFVFRFPLFAASGSVTTA